MARETQPISVNPTTGDETHPAFAVARITNPSSNPGAALFQSETDHRDYVRLAISSASRKRDLHQDWVHPEKDLVVIEMTYAQWASLVSSSSGRDVPVTLSYLKSEGYVPELPRNKARLSESTAEVESAIDRVLERIEAAYDKLEEKNSAENRRNLKNAIAHAKSNAMFAVESLHEHVDKVKENTKSELEAEAMLAYERAGAHALKRAAEAESEGGWQVLSHSQGGANLQIEG